MISMIDLDSLPDATGIYLFRDSKDRIIYIGKAKSIKNRVRQYFKPGRDNRIQIPLIQKNTESIDYKITGSEDAALLLEYNLIRRHQPRYNVMLKDSNKYPFIRITDDQFPLLEYTWDKTEKGVYFGPYTSINFVTGMIEMLNDIYRLRKCKGKLPDKPCIEYQMEKCSAPCTGEITEDAYVRSIDKVKTILKGNYSSMLNILKEKMDEESSLKNYERAAEIRDTIKIIRKHIRRGHQTGLKSNSRDAASMKRYKNRGVFVLVKMRDGVITDIFKQRFSVPASMPDSIVLKELLEDYYNLVEYDDFSILIVPIEIERGELSDIFTKRIEIRVVNKSPTDKKLMQISEDNAEDMLVKEAERDYIPARLRELQNILKLPGTPGLIGGVDISHFSGKWTAGAVVLFKNGKPLKSGYRYYKLDYIGNDDYRAISHILGRYIEKYPLDMVLIDGGKGQLKAAKRAIEDMDKNIAVFSLAKRPDQVYASDYSKVMIPAKSPAFKLIKEIRDEAHRFANKLRRKQMKIE